jgi:hypothetical protein
MVAPQAVARHGEAAWIPSRRYIADLARSGTLHLVMRGNEPVAGICTVRRGDSLWLALSGVRNGDPDLLRQGAGFAALALTINWAKTEGFRYLDAGRTGPFVHDGVQRLKRGRGALSHQPVLVEYLSGIQPFSGE